VRERETLFTTVCMFTYLFVVMQKYSSGLTQYKFDTFGGFYISDVEREIKRGRLLVSDWNCNIFDSCCVFSIVFISYVCLQCFDTVGWASEGASSL